MRAAYRSSAVHGFNSFRHDDNQRRAYQHAGAQECDNAQLASGEIKGERDDACDKRAAVVSQPSNGEQVALKR